MVNRRLVASWCAILMMSAFVGCSSSDPNGDGTGTGCAWNGNCSTMAPEGSYDCLNDDRTLVTCIDGNWETVANCGGFFQGNRTCTCKGGCGTDTVVCSFAFEICGNQEYPTTP